MDTDDRSMKHGQLDIFRNRQPSREDWIAAAEAARSNPYETPEAADRRARYYEQQANQYTTPHQGSNE